MPARLAWAGRKTTSANTSLAISRVASSRARLEWKWANKPLLLIFSSFAKRPMVNAASPSRAAIFSARAKIAWRVRSPCEWGPPVGPPQTRRRLSNIIGPTIIARTFVFMPRAPFVHHYAHYRRQDRTPFYRGAYQVAQARPHASAYPSAQRRVAVGEP